MFTKEIVHSAVLDELQKKINGHQETLDDLSRGLANDSKSSAGDKHETSRAMAQREHDQVSEQLAKIKDLKRIVAAISPLEKSESIQYGSLFESEGGWFFISAGVGKIMIDETDVFCISAVSPLGKTVAGKRKGESYTFNDNSYKVLSLL